MFFLRVWWPSGLRCIPQRVRDGGRASVRTGDAGFGVAVCVECDQFAAVGAAHSGRFGVSLFGGQIIGPSMRFGVSPNSLFGNL